MVAGFVGGLFGVGGGLLMVPGMVLLMGVSQHRAHATSVAAIVAAALAAVTPLAFDHRVDWDTAGLVLVGSVAGAYLGARLMGAIPEVWLARAFVVLVLAAAVRLLLQGEAAGSTAAATATSGFDVGPLGALGMVAIGLFAGALASLLGIGGGIVYVPALVALFSFDQHVAQGTSLAVIVPTAVVAATAHARAGRVDWRLAAGIGAGGATGGLLGAATALSLGGMLLRRMFAGLLVLVTVRMAARARRAAPDPAGALPT